jgi:hypothetical protein
MTTSPTKPNGTPSFEVNGLASSPSIAERTETSTPKPDNLSNEEIQRLELKRLERLEQRRRLEAEINALDAEAKRDELLVNGGNATSIAASAPTSPLGARSPHGSSEERAPSTGPVAPIGQGRDMNGAKSMPASRRTSGYGPTFGMEKLSLSVLEPGGKKWNDEDDVDAEGAQSASPLT